MIVAVLLISSLICPWLRLGSSSSWSEAASAVACPFQCGSVALQSFLTLVSSSCKTAQVTGLVSYWEVNSADTGSWNCWRSQAVSLLFWYLKSSLFAGWNWGELVHVIISVIY